LRKVSHAIADATVRTARHAHLDLYKLPFALMTDLEEGFTCHVLDTWVSLMHEFEELVHHGLQELPMVAQETWILAHHIPERKRKVDKSLRFSAIITGGS